MTLLEVHRTLLEQQRHSANLVGPGDIAFHYEDCRAALAWLEPQGHWVDLGSGAGFPGVVFTALFPHLQMDLVESRQKRAVFLEHVLLTAGIATERCRVLHQRVENLPPQAYDGVVSRAFAPPGVVFDTARRLLVPGGTVILFLQESGTQHAAPGFELFHVEHYTVGGRNRCAEGWRRLG